MEFPTFTPKFTPKEGFISLFADGTRHCSDSVYWVKAMFQIWQAHIQKIQKITSGSNPRSPKKLNPAYR